MLCTRALAAARAGGRSRAPSAARARAMCTGAAAAPPPRVRAPEALAGLEPAALWRFFGELTQIPRPSKKEGAVLAYLREFARERGLETRSDAVGNLVIARPGSGGGEDAPAVCVQGHVDMVTEAEPSLGFDFDTTPLNVVRDGDWVTAVGTTLGADNGIGVAAALALLDSDADAPLPPLEALFTVDEETGLTGAFGLEADKLLTATTMLNLDTEEWGSVYIGCAGGGDSILNLAVATEPFAAAAALNVSVSGCLGGCVRRDSPACGRCLPLPTPSPHPPTSTSPCVDPLSR